MIAYPILPQPLCVFSRVAFQVFAGILRSLDIDTSYRCRCLRLYRLCLSWSRPHKRARPGRRMFCLHLSHLFGILSLSLLISPSQESETLHIDFRPAVSDDSELTVAVLTLFHSKLSLGLSSDGIVVTPPTRRSNLLYDELSIREVSKDLIHRDR